MMESGVEKFPMADLTDLRAELLQSGLDSWQAGELISSFLVARGYGVSSEDARDVAVRNELVGCSMAHMQERLERIAYVM